MRKTNLAKMINKMYGKMSARSTKPQKGTNQLLVGKRHESAGQPLVPVAEDAHGDRFARRVTHANLEAHRVAVEEWPEPFDKPAQHGPTHEDPPVGVLDEAEEAFLGGQRKDVRPTVASMEKRGRRKIVRRGTRGRAVQSRTRRRRGRR